MDRRVTEFLAGAGWGAAQVSPLAGDASARRYFRVTKGAGRAVLMDSGSLDQGPFLQVGAWLRGQGLSAPKVLAEDRRQGLLLLEDLGDGLFARLAGPVDEQTLYSAAVDVLIALDRAEVPGFLPGFEPATMCDQIDVAFDWYRRGIIGESGDAFGRIRSGFETVFANHVPETSTVLLRDYHAENLIWLPDREGLARVGLLDFQDAMVGPAGYDLVSLLFDARRDVPTDLIEAMLSRFCTQTGRDRDTFAASAAVIGAQRNLRILGVFARLCMAQGKAHYVDLIPRVWGHVETCLAHPALAPVAGPIRAALPAPSPDALTRLRDRCATAPMPQ